MCPSYTLFYLFNLILFLLLIQVDPTSLLSVPDIFYLFFYFNGTAAECASRLWPCISPQSPADSSYQRSSSSSTVSRATTTKKGQESLAPLLLFARTSRDTSLSLKVFFFFPVDRFFAWKLAVFLSFHRFGCAFEKEATLRSLCSCRARR